MYFHKSHIVDPSPWPILVSLNLLYITVGGVAYMHYYVKGAELLLIGLIGFILSLSCWFRDVIREGTYNRHHTELVKKNLRLGMLLFIVSEIMFFFSFFWSFFHSSLAPTHYIGCVWPPYGMELIDPFGLPTHNTILLLISGAFLTIAHDSLSRETKMTEIKVILLYNEYKYNEKEVEFLGLKIDYIEISFFGTLISGFMFLVLQMVEYIFFAPFSISDGIYGSLFYLITGFHGIHVLIGYIFILVQIIRYQNEHFTQNNHFGFEASAWYWHFVDVVWLIVYLTIYVWSFM